MRLLRVLIVEDSVDDTLLLLRELKRGGYEVRHERVDTPEAMDEALDRTRWDLVISDYYVPRFQAPDALALLRRRGSDAPFIIVSGKVGEELAVEAMRAGAHDYIMKDNLARLCATVERGLAEAEVFRERERAQEALREAEEKYRSIFENAVEGIFQSTVDGRMLTANPALARIFGYASPEEAISATSNFGRRICADPGRWEEFVEQIRRRGTISGFEARTLRKDGSAIWVSVNARAVYDEAGGLAGFEGFVVDITERKRAEEAVHESEERFRSLIQHASDVITILEADGTIRYESPAGERALGYHPDELIGENVFDYVHPDDSGRVSAIMAEVSKNPGRPLASEFRFRHADGSWRHLEAVVNNQFDDPNTGGVLLNSRDVTERKRTEEKFRGSEERFRATFDQAAVGMAQVGLEGHWLQVNEKLCEIVGYTSEELLGMTFQEITHPDDREADLEHIRRLLAGETETYSMEKRYLRKDGTVVWVDLTVSLVRELSGEPEYFIKVIEDISERKRIEEALKQSERLYRTVVEQAAENIFLVDAETERILEANTALRRSLGYTDEELRQLTLYDIVAYDQEIIDSNIRRALKDGSFFVGERAYRRKDGSLMDVEVSVSVISHAGREALCVVSHDVTEYKHAEESLRRSLSVLLALREAGQILGSTLESEEIVSRLLEIMQRVSNLTAAVISVQDEDGRVRIWRSVGLQGLWQRARYAPEAAEARRVALETEEHHLFLLRRPDYETGHLAGLCLPLRTRDRLLGVLEAYGPESLAESDTVEILGSLASQAASALENAQLYGELGEREHRLQDLVGKLLGAQEEERRHVAYEVHDGLAQVAAAAHQRLQAFARRYPPDTEKARRDLDRVLKLVRQTVSEARRIIANLRPTALDDLGLAAAISLEVERLREDGYRVDYEEVLGEERLPDTVEITLFRVAQEALTNVRKHAQTERVRIELRRRGDEAYLEVRDYGRGFDPAAVSLESGPGERVGLAGMRERVGMLGGRLEIRSEPGAGTSVTVTAPLLTTTVEES